MSMTVDQLFEEFEKAGLYAKQSFCCCQSCGTAKIASDVEGILSRGKKKPEDFKGYVFYHEQDAQTLWITGELHLRYGSIATASFGEVGMKCLDVGELIWSIIQKLGLKSEWEHSEYFTIRVIFEPEKYGIPIDHDDYEGH